MRISDIVISEELIAQHPLPQRDACRLLCLDRKRGAIKHLVFDDICSIMNDGDLLVFNNSKVVKARFWGNKPTGGKAQLLLIRPIGGCEGEWLSMIGGRGIRSGLVITLEKSRVEVEVIEQYDGCGMFVVRFSPGVDVAKMMEEEGVLPLPPYIKRPAEADDHRFYQTVFADTPGSVAAPTAALHFTDKLIDRIKSKGVKIAYLTLHIGYDTFSMIRDIENHMMHEEFYSVDESLEELVSECRRSGGKVWAVGTTVVRTLESAFNEKLVLNKRSGSTSLFIRPGYNFKVVDAIITNFHHPGTTLIHLVSAFSSVDSIVRSYQEATRLRYRLLSYGDAMAIV